MNKGRPAAPDGLIAFPESGVHIFEAARLIKINKKKH